MTEADFLHTALKESTPETFHTGKEERARCWKSPERTQSQK